MTTTRKTEHATGLYLEGIRDGNMRDALDKHVGDRYTQHSTGVASGKEGFLEFFTPFIERTPIRDIQVVRSIEDGRYVFCHVAQSLNNGEAKWVTADLFDTDPNDDDRIVEHWDVIAASVEQTASGRTLTDGPTQTGDFDKTEANKQIVQRFVDEVLVGGNTDDLANTVSREQYDQHSLEIQDGLQSFEAHLAQRAAAGSARQYIKVHHLLGQGNFVVTYSLVRVNKDEYAVFDIYRLKDGKIVEHWDVEEKIGPPDTWNNSGKF